MNSLKKKRYKQTVLWLLLLPSLIGFAVFYALSFFMSLRYSVIDNMTQKAFAGFAQYANVLGGYAFRKAAGNTAIFLAIVVPLNMIVPFLLASLLSRAGKFKGVFAALFAIPLVIPTGATIFFWNKLFSVGGLVNLALFKSGFVPVNWIESAYVIPIISLAFIWKNAGFNVILFTAGLSGIPAEYYDFVKLESVSKLTAFRYVTLIYIAPTAFVALLMSFVNAFKSFREIYGLVGAFPNGENYMLQQYMNSLFSAAELPRLSAAAAIVAAVVALVAVILFNIQRKVTEAYGE